MQLVLTVNIICFLTHLLHVYTYMARTILILFFVILAFVIVAGKEDCNNCSHDMTWERAVVTVNATTCQWSSENSPHWPQMGEHTDSPLLLVGSNCSEQFRGIAIIAKSL